VRLLPLGPRDEAALCALFEANHVPSVTRWFDPFPLTPESARRVAFYEGRDLYRALWDGDAMVAFAMARGWDAGHPQPALGLLVDRHRGGRGLGRAATSLMLDELRRRGEPILRARVHDDNERSLRTMVACGFREIDRSDGRVLLECRLA
jgi:RimJ/RimL family protein N-acetyltransferase